MTSPSTVRRMPPRQPTGGGRGGLVPRSLQRSLGVIDTSPSGNTATFLEEAPELTFPNNLVIYDRMRTTDAQIRSMLRAVVLPALQAHARLAGKDVAPARLKYGESQLGLTEDEKGRRRAARKGGVSWDDFIRQAMNHISMGFQPFERWYEVGASDTPGIDGDVLNLRMAPRMPRTVSYFDLADDGTLKNIRQLTSLPPGVVLPPNANTNPHTGEITIPRDRLVWFANEQEGSDFAGKSVLRSIYKHWLIKDTLLRIGALAADRQGMGVPVVSYPGVDDDTEDSRLKARALELATAMRSGEDSGVAIPQGWQVQILGVTGSVADALEWVKYHDQSISRSMLAMFLDLGHDAGARALGQTFVDYFLLAERAVFRYVEEVVTEDVIRPLWADQFGEGEPYPALVLEDPQPEDAITADAINTLVTAKVLSPDEPLRKWVREHYKLPEEKDPPTPDPAGTSTAQGQPQVGPDGTPMPTPNPQQGSTGSPVGSTGPFARPGQPGQRATPADAMPVAAEEPVGRDRQGQLLHTGDAVGVMLGDGEVHAGIIGEHDATGLVAVHLADGELEMTDPVRIQLAPDHLVERARAAYESILAAAGAHWDPEKHHRWGKGTGRGGKFAPRDGSGAPVPSEHSGSGISKDDPVRTNDVHIAAQALGEGRYVELQQPHQVSTLLDRLDALVRDAKSKGQNAPTYDLCKVSVPGTNLFCAESKGIDRIKMPQLSGIPIPGSPADSLPKDRKGGVDLGPGFVDELARHGISIRQDDVPPAQLRASQRELNGGKVAAIAKAADEGRIGPQAIFVTRDDYIVDGHHRWAANVSAQVSRGQAPNMPVKVIDADIIPVLALANLYAGRMGIRPTGVAQSQEDHARPVAAGEGDTWRVLLEGRTELHLAPAQQDEMSPVAFGEGDSGFTIDGERMIVSDHDRSVSAVAGRIVALSDLLGELVTMAGGVEQLDPETQQAIAMAERKFDNAKHLRYPSGSRQGGRFAPKAGGPGHAPDPSPSQMDPGDRERRSVEAARRVVATASLHEPRITSALASSATKHRAELIGLDFRLKGEGSLSRKIRDKSAAKGIAPEEYASRVGDAVRYTAQLKPESFGEDASAMVADLRSRGFQVNNVENFWAPGNIYRGVHADLVSPEGQKAELQFHTAESFHTKEVLNHKAYEEARLPSTPEPRVRQLNRAMLDNWSRVQEPSGLELLAPATSRPAALGSTRWTPTRYTETGGGEHHGT